MRDKLLSLRQQISRGWAGNLSQKFERNPVLFPGCDVGPIWAAESARQPAASVTNLSDDRSPAAKAYQWASRIMLACLEMVLPCLIGYWIDTKLGTVVVFMVIGLAVGCSLGTWHLMRMIASENRAENSNKDRGD